MFPMPGGIGVSHLRAYDWEAEDGPFSDEELNAAAAALGAARRRGAA